MEYHEISVFMEYHEISVFITPADPSFPTDVNMSKPVFHSICVMSAHTWTNSSLLYILCQSF